MKIDTERRKFFKKAGLSAMSTGLLSIVPFKLFARPDEPSKNPQSNVNVSIKPNPMAVKREKRK